MITNFMILLWVFVLTCKRQIVFPQRSSQWMISWCNPGETFLFSTECNTLPVISKIFIVTSVYLSTVYSITLEVMTGFGYTFTSRLLLVRGSSILLADFELLKVTLKIPPSLAAIFNVLVSRLNWSKGTPFSSTSSIFRLLVRAWLWVKPSLKQFHCL